MRVEKIDRVAIAVRDLGKAMEFFSDVSGVKFDEIRVNERLKYRATYNGIGLELIEPTDESSPVSKFICRRGEGVYLFVFKVSDIEEAKRFMEQKGVRLVGEIRRGELKEAIFHPKDAYGVQIVLCEYNAPHPATCAALHGPAKKQ